MAGLPRPFTPESLSTRVIRPLRTDQPTLNYQPAPDIPGDASPSSPPTELARTPRLSPALYRRRSASQPSTELSLKRSGREYPGKQAPARHDGSIQDLKKPNCRVKLTGAHTRLELASSTWPSGPKLPRTGPGGDQQSECPMVESKFLDLIALRRARVGILSPFGFDSQ